jgi:hypothetical protein
MRLIVIYPACTRCKSPGDLGKNVSLSQSHLSARPGSLHNEYRLGRRVGENEHVVNQRQ